MPPSPPPSRVVRSRSESQRTGRLAIEVAGVRTLNIALGLFTTVVISRALQPDGRGTYVVAILTVTAVATLVGGLGTAVGNSFAVSGPERQVEVVSRSLVLAIVLGGLGSVILVPALQSTLASPIDIALCAVAFPY